jgi:hypothetical protein
LAAGAAVPGTAGFTVGAPPGASFVEVVIGDGAPGGFALGVGGGAPGLAAGPPGTSGVAAALGLGFGLAPIVLSAL